MKVISHPANSSRLPRSAVLLVGWLMMIFLLSDQPEPFTAMGQWLNEESAFADLSTFIHQYSDYDKYLHALVWSVLAALLWLTSASLHSFSLGERAIAVFFIAAVLGSIDEWHQHFTPYRTLSLEDWLADMAGVVLLLCAVMMVHRLQTRSQSPTIHPQGG